MTSGCVKQIQDVLELQKDGEDPDAVWCEQEGEGMCRTMVSHPQSSLINSTCEALAHIRYLSSVRTHPGGEVGFGFKILPKVLVTLEVAEVGLQGERCQEEVGLLSLNALREQHLFPQMPVVVVPGCPVTAGQTDSTINQFSGHMVSRADCTGISCRLRLHFFTCLINLPFST